MRVVISSLALGILVICLSAAGGFEESYPQEDPQIVELKKTVESMKLQIVELNSNNESLKIRLDTHETLLKSTFAWLRALPEVTKSLEDSVASARKNGFEGAGPNPRAKTDLLNGIEAFARTLNKANPVSPPKKK